MCAHLLRRVVVLAATAVAAVGVFCPSMASAAFPGLNGKVAYSHQVDQSSAAIDAVAANGGSPADLSAVEGGAMTADFQPAWSATGKQLAFVRVDAAHCSGQIWTMRQDGSGQTNVSNDAASANEFNPAYGPDGSIVFVRAAPGTFNICTMAAVNQGDLWVRRPNGTTRQLTSGGTDNTPAWSPNATKIAFTRVGQGGPHIMVMNANGTGAPTDLGPGVKPNWSPNGSMIAFAAPGAPNGPPGGPVTVMNASGNNRKTLNTNGTAPVWSPDGNEIAYVAFDQATMSSVIGVMNATGSNQHNVTSPGSGNSDVKPDWQPVIGRLHLSVTPLNAIAGKLTCFKFRVSSSATPVAHARILFAHRRALSSRKGRAQICARLRPGHHSAAASKPGYHVAIARVVALRSPPHPRFTG
jgi:Tol biopolymer transport system component